MQHRLPDIMWRAGVYMAVERLRRTGGSDEQGVVALAQVLQAGKRDYRTLSHALRERLPPALAADVARVDVRAATVKGGARKARVSARMDGKNRALLVCYFHCQLALGDIVRYGYELEVAGAAARRDQKKDDGEDNEERLAALAKAHYQVRMGGREKRHWRLNRAHDCEF